MCSIRPFVCGDVQACRSCWVDVVEHPPVLLDLVVGIDLVALLAQLGDALLDLAQLMLGDQAARHARLGIDGCTRNLAATRSRGEPQLCGAKRYVGYRAFYF